MKAVLLIAALFAVAAGQDADTTAAPTTADPTTAAPTTAAPTTAADTTAADTTAATSTAVATSAAPTTAAPTTAAPTTTFPPTTLSPLEKARAAQAASLLNGTNAIDNINAVVARLRSKADNATLIQALADKANAAGNNSAALNASFTEQAKAIIGVYDGPRQVDLDDVNKNQDAAKEAASDLNQGEREIVRLEKEAGTTKKEMKMERKEAKRQSKTLRKDAEQSGRVADRLINQFYGAVSDDVEDRVNDLEEKAANELLKGEDATRDDARKRAEEAIARLNAYSASFSGAAFNASRVAAAVNGIFAAANSSAFPGEQASEILKAFMESQRAAEEKAQNLTRDVRDAVNDAKQDEEDIARTEKEAGKTNAQVKTDRKANKQSEKELNWRARQASRTADGHIQDFYDAVRARVQIRVDELDDKALAYSMKKDQANVDLALTKANRTVEIVEGLTSGLDLSAYVKSRVGKLACSIETNYFPVGGVNRTTMLAAYTAKRAKEEDSMNAAVEAAKDAAEALETAARASRVNEKKTEMPKRAIKAYYKETSSISRSLRRRAATGGQSALASLDALYDAVHDQLMALAEQNVSAACAGVSTACGSKTFPLCAYLATSTTAAPTTASTSTAVPTAAAPTTAAPTTGAPTTGAPTGGASTDAAPSDAAPTTSAPTSGAPTTAAAAPSEFASSSMAVPERLQANLGLSTSVAVLVGAAIGAVAALALARAIGGHRAGGESLNQNLIDHVEV